MKYVLPVMVLILLTSVTGYANAKQHVPNSIAGLQINDNTKRNGGDYTNFVVNNLEECAQACSRDNKCQSFNYGKERRDCWLKNSMPSGVQNSTVISGVKAKQAAESSANQRRPFKVDTLRLEYDTKRNGGDYKNFTVGNVEECAHACAGDSQCQSFNYGTELRDCWLKNSVPRGEHNTTVISGVKEK